MIEVKEVFLFSLKVLDVLSCLFFFVLNLYSIYIVVLSISWWTKYNIKIICYTLKVCIQKIKVNKYNQQNEQWKNKNIYYSNQLIKLVDYWWIKIKIILTTVCYYTVVESTLVHNEMICKVTSNPKQMENVDKCSSLKSAHSLWNVVQ